MYGDINDDRDEVLGDNYLLDPDDAEQLEYDSQWGTPLMTGVNGGVAGVPGTSPMTCNTTTAFMDNPSASSLQEMRGMIENLRGELDDLKVEPHCTRTNITSLERAAEISSSIISSKVAESSKLKKEVEGLTITVRALSMSSRNGVFQSRSTRRNGVLDDSLAIHSELDVTDEETLPDQPGASPDLPVECRSPSLNIGSPPVEATVDITCLQDETTYTEIEADTVLCSQGATQQETVPKIVACDKRDRGM